MAARCEIDISLIRWMGQTDFLKQEADYEDGYCGTLKGQQRGVVVVLEVAYLGCSDIDTDESYHFCSSNKTSSKGRRGCTWRIFS